MTNLRTEFDKILDEYGHDVLLQRSGRKIRCRCWNEKYQEADSDCRLCLGAGFVSRIERHTVRKQSAVSDNSRPGLGQQTVIGQSWGDAQTFYFRHDVHPKAGDYVYEVGWAASGKPSHLVRAYRINDIRDNRGDNGRIEFWSAIGKTESLKSEFQSMLVRSIGPIKNYEWIQK